MLYTITAMLSISMLIGFANAAWQQPPPPYTPAYMETPITNNWGYQRGKTLELEGNNAMASCIWQLVFSGGVPTASPVFQMYIVDHAFINASSAQTNTWQYSQVKYILQHDGKTDYIRFYYQWDVAAPPSNKWTEYLTVYISLNGAAETQLYYNYFEQTWSSTYQAYFPRHEFSIDWERRYGGDGASEVFIDFLKADSPTNRYRYPTSASYILVPTSYFNALQGSVTLTLDFAQTSRSFFGRWVNEFRSYSPNGERIVADTDGSRWVDIYDAQRLAAAFGHTFSGAVFSYDWFHWTDRFCDFNMDKIIDMYDSITLSGKFNVRLL